MTTFVIEKQGWLKKRAGKGWRQQWHKRWMEIRETEFVYFERPEDADFRAAVDLADRFVLPGEEKKMKHSFVIAHPNGEEFHFAASNEEEQKEWMESFRTAIKKATPLKDSKVKQRGEGGFVSAKMQLRDAVKQREQRKRMPSNVVSTTIMSSSNVKEWWVVSCLDNKPATNKAFIQVPFANGRKPNTYNVFGELLVSTLGLFDPPPLNELMIKCGTDYIDADIAFIPQINIAEQNNDVLRFEIWRDPRLRATEKIETLNSIRDGKGMEVKNEVFSLARELDDELFAEEFINGGGISSIMRIVGLSAGSTQGYALDGLSKTASYVSGMQTFLDSPDIMRNLFALFTSKNVQVVKRTADLLLVICNYDRQGVRMVEAAAKAYADLSNTRPYEVMMPLLDSENGDFDVVVNALALFNSLLLTADEDKQLEPLIHKLDSIGLLTALRSMPDYSGPELQTQLKIFEDICHTAVLPVTVKLEVKGRQLEDEVKQLKTALKKMDLMQAAAQDAVKAGGSAADGGLFETIRSELSITRDKLDQQEAVAKQWKSRLERAYRSYSAMKERKDQPEGGKGDALDDMLVDFEAEMQTFAQGNEEPFLEPDDDDAASECEERYIAIFPYTPERSQQETEGDEIALAKGDMIMVRRKHDDGWYEGLNETSGRAGVFPNNYIEICPPSGQVNAKARRRAARELGLTNTEGGDARGIGFGGISSGHGTEKGVGAGRGGTGAGGGEGPKIPDDMMLVPKPKPVAAPPPPPPPTAKTPGPPPPPPPGAPPPPGSGPALPAARKYRKAEIKPNVKMRPLFWTRITLPLKELSKEPFTVWEDLLEAEFNIPEFEDSFGEKPTGTETDKPKKAKQKAATVLDSKRQMAVSIMMSTLPSLAEFARALTACDERAISEHQIKSVLQHMSPREELLNIKDLVENTLKGDLSQLAVTDRFLLEISKIDLLGARLRCWEFVRGFDEELSDILEPVTKFRRAVRDLRHSQPIETLLGIVLALGNYMNGGNKQRGQADGFELVMLTKLDTVKGFDGQSLLGYIMSYCRKRHPVLEKLHDQYKAVQEASKLDLKLLQGNTHQLKEKLKDMRGHFSVISAKFSGEPFTVRVSTALDKSEIDIRKLLDELNATSEDFKDLLRFYGYKNPEKVQSVEVFELFLAFFAMLQKSWDEEVKREDDEERKRKIKDANDARKGPEKRKKGQKIGTGDIGELAAKIKATSATDRRMRRSEMYHPEQTENLLAQQPEVVSPSGRTRRGTKRDAAGGDSSYDDEDISQGVARLRPVGDRKQQAGASDAATPKRSPSMTISLRPVPKPEGEEPKTAPFQVKLKPRQHESKESAADILAGLGQVKLKPRTGAAPDPQKKPEDLLAEASNGAITVRRLRSLTQSKPRDKTPPKTPGFAVVLRQTEGSEKLLGKKTAPGSRPTSILDGVASRPTSVEGVDLIPTRDGRQNNGTNPSSPASPAAAAHHHNGATSPTSPSTPSARPPAATPPSDSRPRAETVAGPRKRVDTAISPQSTPSPRAGPPPVAPKPQAAVLAAAKATGHAPALRPRAETTTAVPPRAHAPTEAPKTTSSPHHATAGSPGSAHSPQLPPAASPYSARDSPEKDSSERAVSPETPLSPASDSSGEVRRSIGFAELPDTPTMRAVKSPPASGAKKRRPPSMGLSGRTGPSKAPRPKVSPLTLHAAAAVGPSAVPLAASPSASPFHLLAAILADTRPRAATGATEHTSPPARLHPGESSPKSPTSPAKPPRSSQALSHVSPHTSPHTSPTRKSAEPIGIPATGTTVVLTRNRAPSFGERSTSPPAKGARPKHSPGTSPSTSPPRTTLAPSDPRTSLSPTSADSGARYRAPSTTSAHHAGAAGLNTGPLPIPFAALPALVTPNTPPSRARAPSNTQERVPPRVVVVGDDFALVGSSPMSTTSAPTSPSRTTTAPVAAAAASEPAADTGDHDDVFMLDDMDGAPHPVPTHLSSPHTASHHSSHTPHESRQPHVTPPPPTDVPMPTLLMPQHHTDFAAAVTPSVTYAPRSVAPTITTTATAAPAPAVTTTTTPAATTTPPAPVSPVTPRASFPGPQRRSSAHSIGAAAVVVPPAPALETCSIVDDTCPVVPDPRTVVTAAPAPVLDTCSVVPETCPVPFDEPTDTLELLDELYEDFLPPARAMVTSQADAELHHFSVVSSRSDQAADTGEHVTNAAGARGAVGEKEADRPVSAETGHLAGSRDSKGQEAGDLDELELLDDDPVAPHAVPLVASSYPRPRDSFVPSELDELDYLLANAEKDVAP